MYKHVLVPVELDHGHLGGHAIAVARKLLNSDGKISLLHVMSEIPSNVAIYLPEGQLESNRSDAMANLDSLAKNIGANCSSSVMWGHPSRTILDYATEHDVDCIVISSHKPGLEDYFLGSTAARVVRHAKCCVHVMR